MRKRDIEKKRRSKFRRWLDPYPYLVRVAREGSDKASGYSPTKILRNPNCMRRRIMRNPDDIQESLIKHFGEEYREKIKETFSREGRYSSWGNSGSFEFDGQEYNWISDEDEAERIAIDVVKQDLEEEPELFNKDWLMGHIDEDKYWNDVRSDIANWVYEEPESYTRFIDDEEPEEDGEYSEEQKERMADGYLEDLKEQGILSWLEELGCGGDKLSEHLSSYLDIESAKEEAVQIDGWAHFLSRYDGNYDSTKEGVVFFQE